MSNDGIDDRPRLADDRKVRAFIADFLRPKKGGQSNPGQKEKPLKKARDIFIFG